MITVITLTTLYIYDQFRYTICISINYPKKGHIPTYIICLFMPGLFYSTLHTTLLWTYYQKVQNHTRLMLQVMHIFTFQCDMPKVERSSTLARYLMIRRIFTTIQYIHKKDHFIILELQSYNRIKILRPTLEKLGWRIWLQLWIFIEYGIEIIGSNRQPFWWGCKRAYSTAILFRTILKATVFIILLKVGSNSS